MINEMPQELLAKSVKNGRKIPLQRHLFETEQAAQEIFRLDKRWGKNWCRFFKVTEKAKQEKFLLHLRIAALFHDIGKANEEFQSLVNNKLDGRQTIRHEHLSALILHLPEVRNWLRQNENLDLEVITAAVLSHHLKASDKAGCQWLWGQPKEKPFLQSYEAHDEINATFDRIQKVAELPNSLRLENKIWWMDKSPWIEAERGGFDTARNFSRSLSKDNERLKLLVMVKAGLIVADAAASGLVREGYENETFINWINEKAHSPKIESDEVNSKIINERAKAILDSETNQEKKKLVERKQLEGVSWEKALDEVLWNDFQTKSAMLGKKALLLAACGSGKTIAAWKWAEAQSRTHEIGKVIFLYPTRGTATEGFRDYVGFAPEAEASLLHGTSRYELEAIAENPNEATRDKNYLSEAEERLFALGFWGKRYFSATVDQFLSFLEHSYSSLCLLPVLADSALIIDEVHSFDRQMFKNLVAFLEKFDLPVLCMTATLPKWQREQLAKIEGLRVYPNEAEQKELKDLERLEQCPRYKLEFTADARTALDIAVKEYKNEKRRVLWVVNTVQRCQQAAADLKQKLAVEPLVYHSRFRLKDRKSRHEKTVEAFKQTVKPEIAVTTQVCEMSLDLDADVLITEFAPITSLVQRFGRANRHLAKGEDFRARLIVYKPEGDAPYTPKDINDAEKFLRDLGTEDISQRFLALKLDEHSPLGRDVRNESARFLDSGYFAVRGNFRDADDFTNPCILSDDLAKVKECLDEKKPYDAFVVSVPRGGKSGEEPIWIVNDEKPAWLPKYLKVADSRFYRERYGFVPDLDLLNELEETENV